MAADVYALAPEVVVDFFAKIMLFKELELMTEEQWRPATPVSRQVPKKEKVKGSKKTGQRKKGKKGET